MYLKSQLINFELEGTSNASCVQLPVPDMLVSVETALFPLPVSYGCNLPGYTEEIHHRLARNLIRHSKQLRIIHFRSPE